MIEKLQHKLRRYLVKKALLKQMQKNLENLTIYEQFYTELILKGEKYRDRQLIEVQNKVEECKKMLKFLQSV